MNKRAYVREKRITITQQLAALKHAYPEGECISHNNMNFVWRAKVQPTPLSKEYNIRLIYCKNNSPEVWVVGNELEKLDDPNFPHKYKIDKDNKKVKLCLYRFQEFNRTKYLSDTIIPWTIEWLYFYEIWLATGEWCGGGDHP